MKLARVPRIEIALTLSKGCYQGTTYPTPVILSEAPERFVSHQHHWRAVEGSREHVPHQVVSGSSYENASGRELRAWRFFLRDRPWPLPLGAFHSSHGMTKSKRLVGEGTGRIPYVSMVIDNSSGSFDCAPITFERRQAVVALRSG